MTNKTLNINQLIMCPSSIPTTHEIKEIQFLEPNGEVITGFYEPVRPTYTPLLAKLSVFYAMSMRMTLGKHVPEERLVVNDQGDILGTVSFAPPEETHLQMVQRILLVSERLFNKIKYQLRKTAHPDVLHLTDTIFLNEQNIKKSQDSKYYPENKLYPLLVLKNVIEDINTYIENYYNSESNQLALDIHTRFMKDITDIIQYINDEFIYAPKIELVKISDELNEFYRYLSSKSLFLGLPKVQGVPSLQERFNLTMYCWANYIEKNEFKALLHSALSVYEPSKFHAFYNTNTRSAELRKYLKEDTLVNREALALVFSTGGTGTKSLNAIVFRKLLQHMRTNIAKDQNAKVDPDFNWINWILQRRFDNELIEYFLNSLQHYANNYIDNPPQTETKLNSNISVLNRNIMFSKPNTSALNDNATTELQASLLEGFVGFKK